MHPLNFRDVGEALSLWLEAPPIPEGRLYRGGKFDMLSSPAELGDPRTVLNLRRGPDPDHIALVVDVAALNDVENYNTANSKVRRWLELALAVLAAPTTRWPVYVHCTSGRDRTGVVIAAALLLIGVPREVVRGEYLLSDGADEALIERALRGLEGQAPAVDVSALRSALTGRP